MNAIHVIIYGASGLAGSGVFEECLVHPAIGRIVVVGRKPMKIKHPKVSEILLNNFLDYSMHEQSLRGIDACFYCLGVSQTQVPGKEEYMRITYDYTMAAAEALSRLNPGMTFCFLSGAGTDSTMKSRLMWARVKGKTENDLSGFSFGKVYHFRPGLIHPEGTVRPRLMAARILIPVFPVLNFLFPAWVTTTREFGKAMINAALGLANKNVIENKEIRELSRIVG